MPRFIYKVGQVVQRVPQTMFEQREIGIIRQIFFVSTYFQEKESGYHYDIEWIHIKSPWGNTCYTTVAAKTAYKYICPANDAAVLLYG